METDLERLSQLRIATYTQHLPRDLGLWVLAVVEDAMPHVVRVRRRNEFLQQASDLLPKGSKRARAAMIADGIRRLKREHSAPAACAINSFDWCIASAIASDPKMPSSARHILRLLDM